MNTIPVVQALRVRLAALVILLAPISCGQQESEFFSSTLQVPASPGDGYGLVKTSDDLHDILHIAVANNALFFEIPWHGVYAMPKYGGDVTGVDRDTSAQYYGLAVSGDSLSWLKAHFDSNDYPDGLLLKRPVLGGASTVLRHGDISLLIYNNTNGLFADATHVYVLGESSIAATPLEGGITEQMALPEDPTLGLGFVTFAADYPAVYFTICDSVTRDCVLRRGDFSGAPSQVMAAVPVYAQIIGVDAGVVYLLDGKRLWSVSRVDGGGETDLIPAGIDAAPRPPAVVGPDGVYFYGSDPAVSTLPAGRIMSVPKSGGTPVVIGSDQRIQSYVPWDMAIDDQFVFVLTSPMNGQEGNEILAFPKPLPPSP